jgi:glycosyltransferase involved in cell wall biosynthesis
MRLGILTSHPIQYQAPWFRGLAKAVDLEVFFAHRQSSAEQSKAGFGVAFEWDVDLLSGYSHRFLENRSPQPGVNHFSGCDTPEIRKIIRDGKFDAFVVTGWHLKSYWQAVRACRRALPVLVRGDSHLLTPRSPLKRWVKAVGYQILLRQFDGFLVVGKRNAEYLAHYGAPMAKMFSAPHFVDNEWFAGLANQARNNRSELRTAWNASERRLVALFVGKLQAVKRPCDLLLALAEPHLAGADVMAVFVGSGEMESVLRKKARELGIRAHFAGFKNQTELPACYAAADVLVLPSESETWGLVVNEAMACGLPAVVSDAVGCGPDLIEEGKTGFTFRLGRESELAARLAVLVNMKSAGHDFVPALREKLRNYSLKTAVAGTLRGAEKLAAMRK